MDAIASNDRHRSPDSTFNEFVSDTHARLVDAVQSIIESHQVTDEDMQDIEAANPTVVLSKEEITDVHRYGDE